ncbi:MAG: Methylamine utilization protein mauG [Labilithrix sp.]|nr:Methylamine utilization protein mauG [Labilithrix sp.]
MSGPEPRRTSAMALDCAYLVALGLAIASFVACSDEPKATPSRTSPPAPDGGPPPSAPDGGDLADAATPVEYPFPLPPGFPKPYVPQDNPLTTEKVELGRHLFYDKRLSGNGTQSCASCHEQARAFTDGRTLAIGSTGQSHPRNSMTLANLAYAASLTWPNPVLTELELQARVPLFGIDPIVELGLRGREDEALGRLRAESRYPPLFAAAFPGQLDPFTMDNVLGAIASFQRTLISGNSPFDRFQYRGEVDALTPQQKRGSELFRSETLECFHCHGGFNFTDAVVYKGIPLGDTRFHNTGLYNIGGSGDFPANNRGLIEFTGVPSDMGRFKAPTLRNVEKTAPYMHDGSIATLEEVVEHYATGGRTIEGGPHAGVGSSNPFKSSFIVSFTISDEDKAALIAFLRSLTDDEFLTNPKLADPWAN